MFAPCYVVLVDHRVVQIVNELVVILLTPDGKEKRCNIHNLKPINTSQAFSLVLRTSKKVLHATKKRQNKLHMGTILEKECRDTHHKFERQEFTQMTAEYKF